MNAFETYARELEKRLPWTKRRELMRELLSDLHSELEAAKEAAPNVPDEVLMRQIIEHRELPQELASSLAQRNTALVGPRVYPAYRLSLWLSLLVSLLLVVSVILGFDNMHMLPGWDLLGRLSLVTVLVFFIVTVVFAAMDRFDTPPALSKRAARPVHRVVAPPRPRPLWLVSSELLFPALVLAVFNLFPRYIGLPLATFQPHVQIRVVPVLSTSFLADGWVFVDAWCLVSIASGFLRIFGGRFHGDLWWHFGLRSLGLALLAGILLHQPIFTVPDRAALDMFPSSMVGEMQRMFSVLFGVLSSVFWLGLGLRLIALLRDALWFRRIGRSK